MFSKFFDWLKKKEKCESKRDFEKVDIDNANEININTSTKANCEIVKDLTTNVVSNDSVIKNSITKENFTKENFAKSLFDAKERLSSMREIYYAANFAGAFNGGWSSNGALAGSGGNGRINTGGGYGDDNNLYIYFNASNSNAIYKDTTVQPSSLVLNYIIKY